MCRYENVRCNLKYTQCLNVTSRLLRISNYVIIKLVVINYSLYIALVDGGYGEWSGWSECTKTCGKAYKQRERKCDSPTPSNGGKQCGVGGTQVKVCPQKLCPGIATSFWS